MPNRRLAHGARAIPGNIIRSMSKGVKTSNRTTSLVKVGSYPALAAVLIALGMLAGIALGSLHVNGWRSVGRSDLSRACIGDWPPQAR
jgi:hypothetical protein